MLNRLRGRLAGRRRTPAAVDVEAFLEVARQSFVRVQQAWDRADLNALAGYTSDALLEDLRQQLALRPPGPNHTEVLSLQARLLALEELREAMVASVEFSGVIREHLDTGAMPFRELWLLAKPQGNDRGWQIARVQSLS